jgi:hypothetical protein
MGSNLDLDREPPSICLASSESTPHAAQPPDCLSRVGEPSWPRKNYSATRYSTSVQARTERHGPVVGGHRASVARGGTGSECARLGPRRGLMTDRDGMTPHSESSVSVRARGRVTEEPVNPSIAPCSSSRPDLPVEPRAVPRVRARPIGSARPPQRLGAPRRSRRGSTTWPRRISD